MGVSLSQPLRNHGPNPKEGGETERCLEQVCHNPPDCGEVSETPLCACFKWKFDLCSIPPEEEKNTFQFL